MKILINSNVKYRKALTVLIESMLKAGFKNFNDIILVQSEAEVDSEPMLVNLFSLVDIEITGKPWYKTRSPYLSTNNQIVLVKIKNNGFDYGGFSVLNKFKDHALIKSDYYFYTHDTTEFESNFQEKLSLIQNKMVENRVELITSDPVYDTCNIIFFSSTFIERYGTIYNRSFTKLQAVQMEYFPSVENLDGVVNIDGINYRSIYFYTDNRLAVKGKRYVYDIDRYNLGVKRSSYYFEDFGVYKFILDARYGDMHNNVKHI